MSLSVFSIAPDINRCQVTEMSEFRRSKPGKDYSMDDDIARLKAALEGSSKSILKEDNARLVLRLMSERDGVTIAEIRQVLSERHNIELGYTQAKRIVSRLEKEHWCTHIELKQPQTGIKPVHVFRLVSTLDPEKISQIVDNSVYKNTSANFQCPTPDEDSSYEFLRSVLNQLRPSARPAYFKLTSLVGQGVSTMIALANATGDKNQSIHTRLTKLGNYKILGREKSEKNGRVEFHYFLDSGITVEHLKRFSSEGNISFPEINLHSPSQSETDSQEVEMPSQQSSSESDSFKPSIHEKLLEHLPSLPNFDPSWSDEIKADWIKAYRQIAELAQKGS